MGKANRELLKIGQQGTRLCTRYLRRIDDFNRKRAGIGAEDGRAD
jgi:hypothetical protein